ncbi:F510_1955 family glycosylhydrolase [Cytobacillus firmus]|uniref:Glycosyl hydrolase n=1 Tax=Cytobacillus firmus TaxID=1399 RepID=A0AA46SL87_CYTFI|nr:glycosyl hydrolase [Cytobacillus firmus]UYG98092.1 glycosyl hydrolase [Cytobacillus firmus]
MNLRLFTLTFLILTVLPLSAFAHGTEAEHQEEGLVYNKIAEGGLLISVILLLISVAGIIVISKQIKSVKVKSQKGQKKSRQLKRSSTILKWISAATLLSSIIFGFMTTRNPDAEQESTIGFQHIHGLGYTNDGKRIYIPAHDGLRVFSNGKWQIPEGEKHDYMGFSMVDDGFYSSGHPGPASNLKNPFGIVKSKDLGKSLEILDLYKEIDFHGMAVGYDSHAIYVLNPQPNSKMDDTGLYYTLDETKTWSKSQMNGLTAQPASIAVHPSDKKVIAIGTKEGTFLSTDFGNTFESILPGVPASAIHFTKENKLLVGGLEEESVLYEINLDTMEKNRISIPKISNEDAITYIAVNPQNSSEIVFTSYEKQIYITKDTGSSWTQIAKDGAAIDSKDKNETN